jgi:hypothetical protein
VEATIVQGPAARVPARRFFVVMGCAFVLIAFLGFIPSYWARLASGDFHPPPIVHIHGALLFSWTIFYLLQTGWVASGRVARHRDWGLAGISLFTLLICSIVITKITVMRLDDLHGQGEASRRFAAVIFCAIPVMIGLFIAAVANVRRPEVHKRLMYSLLAGMMTPAIARVFIWLFAPPGTLQAGPPPPFVAIPPSFVAALLIVAAMIYDWRTQRRVHRVYLYGVVLTILPNVVAAMIAPTHAWLATAAFLEHLGG